MLSYSPDWDLSTIPNAALMSEVGRRNAAKRKTFGAGTGRPRKIAQLVGTLLLICMTAHAQEKPRIDWLRVSQATLISAAVADTASSWGQYETNPILGRGQFGARQLAVKSGISIGGIYAFNRLDARHPRIVTTVNFALTGLLGWAAAHNVINR